MLLLLGFFPGRLFSKGLVIGGNFVFQNGFRLSIEKAKHQDNNLKQLKTAKSNSPWAYIREDREGFFGEGGLVGIGILR